MILINIEGEELSKIVSVIIPLLSALGGGLIAFWGTHWKTQEELKEKRKDERRNNATKISEVTAHLQITVARGTTTPPPTRDEDQQRCISNIGESYENALFTLCQYSYCLPDEIRRKIQDFLDTTYQNIKHWHSRLDYQNNPDDPVFKLAYKEACRSELPHVDQAEGAAYHAFTEMNDSLRKYVEGSYK